MTPECGVALKSITCHLKLHSHIVSNGGMNRPLTPDLAIHINLRCSFDIPFNVVFKLNFFFNVYLFLRERERQIASRGGAEREGET